MKFFGAIVAMTGVQAAHKVCSLAAVAEDGVPIPTTLPNVTVFNGTNGNDAPFEALCGGDYQDFFFKYTATCSGAGLVSFWGNVNVTTLDVGVFTGTCAAPVLAGRSSSQNSYALTDMTNGCTSSGRDTTVTADGTFQVQYHQFVAVLGTEYIIRASKWSSSNPTWGEDKYDTMFQCSAPASSDSDAPTEVEEGTFTYSNLGGSSSGQCTGGHDVFLEYEATCTGSVNFTMIGGAGYQGEDLEMAVYDGGFQITDQEKFTCQDDPAIVYANASATSDDWGTAGSDGIGRNQGLAGAGLMGGVKKGNKYTIQVGGYGTSQVSPFVFEISECVGDGSSSGAATLAVPFFGLLALFC